MAKEVKSESPSKNGEAVKMTSPAPASKPPGVVTGRTHGPSKPIQVPAKMPVVDRLRAAMRLSAEVPDEQVIGEAIERLEKLR